MYKEDCFPRPPQPVQVYYTYVYMYDHNIYYIIVISFLAVYVCRLFFSFSFCLLYPHMTPYLYLYYIVLISPFESVIPMSSSSTTVVHRIPAPWTLTEAGAHSVYIKQLNITRSTVQLYTEI